MGSTFAVNIFSERVLEISYKASAVFIVKPPIMHIPVPLVYLSKDVNF